MLKSNQSHLHGAMVATFVVEQNEGCHHDFHKIVNRNHSRIEIHCYWMIEAAK